MHKLDDVQLHSSGSLYKDAVSGPDHVPGSNIVTRSRTIE